MKKEFKFPTILGIVVLIISLAVGVYLTQSKVNLRSGASGSCTPDSVQVTNITNHSANISFLTSSLCLSTVSVNNQTINDLRSVASRIHYFEVQNLSATRDYNFQIISDGNTVSNPEYRFTTASTPSSSIPTSNLAWGRVFNPDKKTPASAILFLNIPGAAPLSSVVSTEGNWSVSLANSFNDTKTNWFTPPETPISEDIIVFSDDGVTTQITNSTAINNPVPNIIVGENFLEDTNTSQITSGQIDTSQSVATQKAVDIFNPKDGDMLSTDRPDFFGSAPINSNVIIEVHSDVAVNGQTSSDNSGTWHWSPPQNLSPGAHTITVKVQNATTGLWETVTRNFTVLASDNSSPQYTASASATIITPSPFPTATIVPTVAPTDTPAPTTRVARPSTTVKPPVTGNTAPTIIIITASLIFFVFSVKFIK